jgi:lipopolysaccharide/colanic/teichoic acid biosynthesis glycosyltransferase
MDTSFAPPQPNPTLLWTEVASERIEEYSATLFPLSTALREVQDVPAAEPSAWSLSHAKRCLDFILALVAILLCWPLLLLTAIVVCFESPGPAIFRQKRVGRGGKLFTVYKFRTMEVTTQHDGPSMTKRGDRRITRVGSFLRKHKLDELPQLFNVLRGDMSLVGPRPRLSHHTDVTSLPFRPGLTGAATLAFRCEEEMLQHIPDHQLEAYNSRLIIPLKGKLDWDYMGQATLASDLALLWETAACCLSRRPNTFLLSLPSTEYIEN